MQISEIFRPFNKGKNQIEDECIQNANVYVLWSKMKQEYFRRLKSIYETVE